MTTYYDHCDTAAKKIVAHVGKQIILGVPLGIGKPVGLINALYRMALADSSLSLTIMTGLTLARPLLHNFLEKRFVEPLLERILKNYEDPLYEHARERQQLPHNIRVIEFFLTPAKYLHNSYVQQNYISSKYTSVIQDSVPYHVNVYAHQVAPDRNNQHQYSLSCNTDLFHGMAAQLQTDRQQGKKVALVAEVNANLPFMPNEAIVKADVFTDVIDMSRYASLFVIPRDELSPQDHLIGLYTSCLIKDDGCLQIGLGKLSNAVANALIMRDQYNAEYKDLLHQLSADKKFAETILAVGGLDPFKQGLYSSTEMFSDEFMALYKAGILRKQVYDHIGLQQLLNEKKITPKITPEFLDILLANKLINPHLTQEDIDFLQKFGIFNSSVRYQSTQLILATGETISANLTDFATKQRIIAACLGDYLKSGKIIHAGFFIGSEELYQQLRDLPADELAKFAMVPIARTNTVSWSKPLSQLQRKDARLVNTTMMVTLGGELVSDSLQNLQEVSGVGGQFDFINMAHELIGARSIINCRSTRINRGKTTSNIIWSYPNITVPRYLRDIVVTEYGIADCRSKLDSEVIKALLNVADSRFQSALLLQAKKHGKIAPDYQIPAEFQRNEPKIIESIIAAIRRKGYCQPYPFGSELTEEEKVLQRILLSLKNTSRLKIYMLIISAIFSFANADLFKNYLARMQLQSARSLKEKIYRRLLVYLLAKNT